MNHVLSLSVVVCFALVPVFMGFSQLAPSLPPEPLILLRACLAVSAVASAAYVVLARFAPDAKTAATSVAFGFCLLLFYPTIRHGMPGDIWTHYPRLFALADLTVCAAAAIGIWRARVLTKEALSQALAIVAAVLAVSGAVQLGRYYGHHPRFDSALGHDELQDVPTATAPADRPDIYHLVLDEFGRPDVLRARYGVDLSDLTRGLKSRGFDLQDNRGFANYTQTYLSLASILNARYLTPLGERMPEVHSREPLRDLIQDSSVLRAIKRLGYDISFFGSIYSATQSHQLADHCDCDRPLIGEFEALVIKNTPFSELGFLGLDYRPHRNKIRRTIARLKALQPSQRPRYVFAHIMSPHPPFVFDAGGRDVHAPRAFDFSEGTMFAGSRAEYVEGYAAQARFMAGQLIEIVDRFEALSRAQGRDCIIIVHGDHGSRWSFDAVDARRTDAVEVMPVLLAIKWAPNGDAAAQDVTSLVNIYRELFRRYFGTPTPPMPDHAYLSSFMRPYTFIEVDPSTFQTGP